MDEEMTIQEVSEYLVNEANNADGRVKFIYEFAANAVWFQEYQLQKTWEDFVESSAG